MGQWNMCVRRGDTLSMHIHYFFFPHSHVVFVGPHKHRIPMDPQYKGVQQDSKQAQDKCVTSVVEQMGHLSPERPSFPFEP